MALRCGMAIKCQEMNSIQWFTVAICQQFWPLHQDVDRTMHTFNAKACSTLLRCSNRLKLSFNAYVIDIHPQSLFYDSHAPQLAMHAEVNAHARMARWSSWLHLTSYLMTIAEGRPGVAEADKQQIRSNLVPVIIRSFPLSHCQSQMLLGLQTNANAIICSAPSMPFMGGKGGRTQFLSLPSQHLSQEMQQEEWSLVLLAYRPTASCCISSSGSGC